jgi:recombination protein RecT
VSEPTGSAVVPATTAEEKLQAFIAKLEPAIAKVLPKHFTVERVVTAALMAATRTPEINECTKESIALAIMKCARLGLDIGEDIHLVPVNNKKGDGWVKTCEAWPDYKGLMRLAMQGNLVRDMVPYVVYQGDHFEVEQGLNERLLHRPCAADKRGKMLGAYVIITKRYGIRTFHWMPIEDIEAIRAKSKQWSPAKAGASCPPWYAMKTVLKAWLNRQPKTVKLNEALERDDTEPPSNVDLATGEVLNADPSPAGA